MDQATPKLKPSLTRQVADVNLVLDESTDFAETELASDAYLPGEITDEI